MKSTIFKWNFLKFSLLCSLLVGGLFISCSKDDDPAPVNVDKAALQAALTTAIDYRDNTSEGTVPGTYEVGSQAALIAAINAAQSVMNNASATQAQVNNAVAQLNAAIAEYESHYIDEIAAANLVGYWKMNGNTNDSSGNNRHGVATAGHAFYGGGTLAPATDRFGRANMAYTFDKGSNIEVPYSTALNPQQMSISVWAKWTDDGRTVNLDTYTMLALNRWNGYKFQLQGGHLPFYTVKVLRGPGDTTIHDRDDAGIAVPENEWRHLVVTFVDGTTNFYINGDLVKSWDNTPGTALTLPNPINFTIGQDLPTSKYETVDGDFQVAWGGFWTGVLDDVMLYNVALTGPQVASIYNNQKP